MSTLRVVNDSSHSYLKKENKKKRKQMVKIENVLIY